MSSWATFRGAFREANAVVAKEPFTTLIVVDIAVLSASTHDTLVSRRAGNSTGSVDWVAISIDALEPIGTLVTDWARLQAQPTNTFISIGAFVGCVERAFDNDALSIQAMISRRAVSIATVTRDTIGLVSNGLTMESWRTQHTLLITTRLEANTFNTQEPGRAI